MPESGPPHSAFSDLPYLDEYMREILRPRTERTLQAITSALHESVWQHLVRLLAAEQPAATDATPVMIRKMLEEQLGLRIDVSLNATFAGRADAAAPPEVVVPRRSGTSLPLADAVISGTGRAKRP